ncbi:MAG: hypothetical protein HY701_01550 [Gemmatimonadetes bacterium]|nr:hypothetical protein [Gemmatimonadota bacterium]
MTRDGDDARAVGHDDVFALPYDVEHDLLKGADRVEVIDPGDAGHG